jgi:hypothetical protein
MINYSKNNHNKPKLTPAEVLQIRKDFYEYHYTFRGLAERHQVSINTIQRVVSYTAPYHTPDDMQKGVPIFKYKEIHENKTRQQQRTVRKQKKEDQNSRYKSMSQLNREFQKANGLYNPNSPERMKQREYMREYRKKKKAEKAFKDSIFHY